MPRKPIGMSPEKYIEFCGGLVCSILELEGAMSVLELYHKAHDEFEIVDLHIADIYYGVMTMVGHNEIYEIDERYVLVSPDTFNGTIKKLWFLFLRFIKSMVFAE